MKAIEIFEQYAQKYDEWFENHPYVYQSEIAALSRFLPRKGRGLEIGVGTGCVQNKTTPFKLAESGGHKTG